MHMVDFMPGTHIDRAACELVEAAKVHGEAEGRFNDITLRALSSHTPGEIVAFYNVESELRAEVYRNSPEGKAAARRSDQERSDLQAQHDGLMARLPSLNWQYDAAVLDWLCQMQPCTDLVGVIVRRDTIVQAFEKHDFVAGENTGADYKDGDRKNMFRYLVGQALDGLKNGPAIHPILRKFAAEWRERFGIPPTESK
jgi:hypothetical protein